MVAYTTLKYTITMSVALKRGTIAERTYMVEALEDKLTFRTSISTKTVKALSAASPAF